MSHFHNLSRVNGFDLSNLNNARQNNYAWSMSELGDSIYVGTGRNIILNIIRSIEPMTQLPVLIKPDPIDYGAEIWGFKKDGYQPWQKVYKAPDGSGISGFRFMIKHEPFGGSPCLFAVTFGSKVQILKTTNGVNWFILPDNVLQGTSSRAMVIQKGKLYVSTIDEESQTPTPRLYCSKDPEFHPWESLIDINAPGFNPAQNPTGAISSMAVFNDKIYVGISNSGGAQVWRTNEAEPKLNDWTLVVDKGFGDAANKYTLSMGVFKNHLYVSGTKLLPLAWFMPMGCDIIRIGKNDAWEIIVGGNTFLPLTASSGSVRKSASGLGSGFNNPFNVYAWQIQEYNDQLLISSFDNSSNMEVILGTLLANKPALEQLIGTSVTNVLIEIYKGFVGILGAIKYPMGFDLYISEDGVQFSSIFMNGLDNPHNYGGRILFVDSHEKLYLGTANPFQGCEVWRTREIDDTDKRACSKDHYKSLRDIREIICVKYDIISQNMPAILKFLPKDHYLRFF